MSIEPDGKNFDMLKLNTARFGNVVRLNRGLWSRTTSLRLVREDCPETSPSCGSWEFRVRECCEAHADLQAISVPDVLHDLHLSHFDIVKMDIEGAEEQVLATRPDWVHDARMVSVEMHLHGMPEPTDAIFNHMSKKFRDGTVGE